MGGKICLNKHCWHSCSNMQSSCTEWFAVFRQCTHGMIIHFEVDGALTTGVSKNDARQKSQLLSSKCNLISDCNFSFTQKLAWMCEGQIPSNIQEHMKVFQKKQIPLPMALKIRLLMALKPNSLTDGPGKANSLINGCRDVPRGDVVIIQCTKHLLVNHTIHLQVTL